MNCADIQRICLEYAGEALPADVQTHLAGCAECRAAGERAAFLVRLVALKRFEQPDAAFEARSLAAIRIRVQEINEQPSGWLAQLRAWLEFHPAPALGVAAVVLAFAGWRVTGTLSGGPGGAPSVAAVQPASTGTIYYATPVMLASSNGGPGRVQYGPGDTVPVKLQY